MATEIQSGNNGCGTVFLVLVFVVVIVGGLVALGGALTVAGAMR